MSAKKEINKLAIIAGSGDLPRRLISACEKLSIEVFIVAFDGNTDKKTVENNNHIWTSFAKAGQIIKTLRSHDIKDIVMIGAIKRPSLLELRPDFETLKILTKIGFKSMGDDSLLKSIRIVFEEEGFKLHGVHKFADELLSKSGNLTKKKPANKNLEDIRRGIEVARKIGEIDIGQSVVVEDGIVLGVEAIEGTDELLKRCANYMRSKNKAVLIKLSKSNQDNDLDMPTIGLNTIENISKLGYAGVIVESGKTLIVDESEAIYLADKNKVFIFGAEINTDNNISNL